MCDHCTWGKLKEVKELLPYIPPLENMIINHSRVPLRFGDIMHLANAKNAKINCILVLDRALLFTLH